MTDLVHIAYATPCAFDIVWWWPVTPFLSVMTPLFILPYICWNILTCDNWFRTVNLRTSRDACRVPCQRYISTLYLLFWRPTWPVFIAAISPLPPDIAEAYCGAYCLAHCHSSIRQTVTRIYAYLLAPCAANRTRRHSACSAVNVCIAGPWWR